MRVTKGPVTRVAQLACHFLIFFYAPHPEKCERSPRHRRYIARRRFLARPLRWPSENGAGNKNDAAMARKERALLLGVAQRYSSDTFVKRSCHGRWPARLVDAISALSATLDKKTAASNEPKSERHDRVSLRKNTGHKRIFRRLYTRTISTLSRAAYLNKVRLFMAVVSQASSCSSFGLLLLEQVHKKCDARGQKRGTSLV